MNCQSVVLHFVLKGKKNAVVLNSSVIFLHGGSFSCSVVPQKGCNLTLVESQCQVVHSKLFAIPIDLHQVLNIHPQVKMSGLFLNAHSLKIKKKTTVEKNCTAKKKTVQSIPTLLIMLCL